MSNRRITENNRFSYRAPFIPSEAEILTLFQRHFPDKTGQEEWQKEATNRIQKAFRVARFSAFSNWEPTVEEGQKRMEKIAKLCGQLLELLTDSTEGSDLCPYIHLALAREGSDEVGFSRPASADLDNAVAGIHLVRRLALATPPSAWDALNVHNKREANYFLNALQAETEKFWKWATGAPPRFSTPHQRHRSKSTSAKPRKISTEKTGAFVRFFQDLAGVIQTGRSIAARLNRRKRALGST